MYNRVVEMEKKYKVVVIGNGGRDIGGKVKLRRALPKFRCTNTGADVWCLATDL